MINAQFTMADFERMLNKGIDNITDTMQQTLQYVGERFVVNVRTKINADEGYRTAMRAISKRPKVSITEGTPRYADRKGPLTASIGFNVLRNGKVVISHFPGSGEGRATGELAAKEIGAKFPNGLVLVVVAGMQYAAAVESLGYDVLTGSSFIAERELKEALNAILPK